MSWVQLLIVALMIGGPILGKIAEALKKQKALRDAERMREIAAREALRTGRAPETARTTAPTSGQTAADRMRELARRRQEQLQELRRRQQAQQQAGQTPAPPQLRRPTQPGGPRPQTRPQPVPQQRPQTGQRPSPQPTGQRPQSQPQTRPQPRPQPRPQQRPQTQSRRQPQTQPQTQRRPSDRPQPVPTPTGPSIAASAHYEIDHDEVHRLVSDAPAQKAGSAAQRFGAGMSRDDWRRFMIAREVLGPPMALRDSHQDDGALP